MAPPCPLFGGPPLFSILVATAERGVGAGCVVPLDGHAPLTRGHHSLLFSFYLILSCFTLHYLTLSYLTLSYIILSYHVLSYLILSYLMFCSASRFGSRWHGAMSWKDRTAAPADADWRNRAGPPLPPPTPPHADGAGQAAWRNRSELVPNKRPRRLNDLAPDWRDRAGPEVGLPDTARIHKPRLNFDRPILAIAAGQATGSNEGVPSHFASRGMSKERINTILKHGACSCKKACAHQFSAKLITDICCVFWSMPKEDQDYLIHTMYQQQRGAAPAREGWRDRKLSQEDDPDETWEDNDMGELKVLSTAAKSKVQWAIADTDVCMEAFYRILGIGKHRLLRAVGGSVDLRRTLPGMAKKPPAREAKQSALCHRFFAELYVSSAEPMPNEFRQGGKDVAVADMVEDETTDPFIDTAALERELQDLLPHFLDGAADAALTKAPVRMLQYSRTHDLYWLFIATLQEWLKPTEAKPSWMTFWRCWNSTWAKFLHFRKSSEHSKCTFCWKSHQCLKQHISLADKYAVARKLREHLRMQYTDRCIYYALRWSSRLKTAGVLVVIIDSMDKSKLAIPRWDFGTKPKIPWLAQSAAAQGVSDHPRLSPGGHYGSAAASLWPLLGARGSSTRNSKGR